MKQLRKLSATLLCSFGVTTILMQQASADTDSAKGAEKIPLGAASMASGIVVGTPVAIVRKTGGQYVECLNEFKNDSNTWKFWGAFYSLPVAVTAGLVKGAVYGPKNAIGHSINRPFSKEAFSLGELEGQPVAHTKREVPSPYEGMPESQPWGTPKTPQ